MHQSTLHVPEHMHASTSMHVHNLEGQAAVVHLIYLEELSQVQASSVRPLGAAAYLLLMKVLRASSAQYLVGTPECCSSLSFLCRSACPQNSA